MQLRLIDVTEEVSDGSIVDEVEMEQILRSRKQRREQKSPRLEKLFELCHLEKNAAMVESKKLTGES